MATKKTARHQTIRELIRREQLPTQNDIQARLKELGYMITQTTLSRDIHELGLIKVYDKKTKSSYYVLSEDQVKVEFVHHLTRYVLKVDRVQFMLVLHTRLGETGVAANLIDKAKPHDILGTIAGADTLLLICRDEYLAEQLEKDINQAIQGQSSRKN